MNNGQEGTFSNQKLDNFEQSENKSPKKSSTNKTNKGRVDPRRKVGLTPNVAGNYRGKKSAEELLTEEQKKLHHIASEQKRRRNIKLGYDRLADIVPLLRAETEQSSVIPSETVILQRCKSFRKLSLNFETAVEYLENLVQEHAALEADLKNLQELNTHAYEEPRLK
ncbi:Transcription factor [Entomophthora muscae]|uniref:Transcription factor n=1 Tax=Entomophthora muscae TaxID=34485 RepID=A0ACC2RY70_9FUNG|nr:Transcription factor [Entomophthora muscae]